jgi:hypothetical protein
MEFKEYNSCKKMVKYQINAFAFDKHLLILRQRKLFILALGI